MYTTSKSNALSFLQVLWPLILAWFYPATALGIQPKICVVKLEYVNSEWRDYSLFVQSSSLGVSEHCDVANAAEELVYWNLHSPTDHGHCIERCSFRSFLCKRVPVYSASTQWRSTCVATWEERWAESCSWSRVNAQLTSLNLPEWTKWNVLSNSNKSWRWSHCQPCSICIYNVKSWFWTDTVIHCCVSKEGPNLNLLTALCL